MLLLQTGLGQHLHTVSQVEGIERDIVLAERPTLAKPLAAGSPADFPRGLPSPVEQHLFCFQRSLIWLTGKGRMVPKIMQNAVGIWSTKHYFSVI